MFQKKLYKSFTLLLSSILLCACSDKLGNSTCEMNEHKSQEEDFISCIENNGEIIFEKINAVKLSDSAKKTIQNIYDSWKRLSPEIQKNIMFTIHANTCAVGSKKANIIVATSRAESIKNHMVQLGIPACHFTIHEILPAEDKTYILDNPKSPSPKNRKAYITVQCNQA